MATQLTIVNNVLRRLREDTVTSVADNAYAQLVAMWVNDGMRYTQEAYDWRMLENSVQFDLVADQANYDLSATVATTGDVITGGNVTTVESMLKFDDSTGRPLAFAYDDANFGVGDQMIIIPDAQRVRLSSQDTDQSVDEPLTFAIYQTSDGVGLGCALAYKPQTTRRIAMTFWTPQAELATDGTADATVIKVPQAPVEAYVHMVAANERGEEIGEPGNLLERRWQNVLGAAIEAAMHHDNRTNRYESWRD